MYTGCFTLPNLAYSQSTLKYPISQPLFSVIEIEEKVLISRCVLNQDILLRRNFMKPNNEKENEINDVLFLVQLQSRV